MTKHVYELPLPGEIRLSETEKRYIDFITENQLKDESLWRRFESAFRDRPDPDDRGWRGEYWGKVMRGGCLVYRCTADGSLYEILKTSVENLLALADEDGRISSYTRETECTGWDIWCRKYVLTGMLHFCDICKDEPLKERILDAMEKHVDSLAAKVGPGPGQVEITETSDFWLGVNSCSILETVMDLYGRRPEDRFLEFAEYIIGTGGCSGGNLAEIALKGEKAPFEYPENKAYETMSYFEGLLAYYEVTGKSKYLDAVLRFAEKVYETDITVIGCAGCMHEQFDNSAVKQTEYNEKVMQETCVTVTWMRLCARLFLLTGDKKFAERVEQSALNALYGSVNINKLPVTIEGGRKLSGLPFDSYSPLYMNKRGRVVGGLKFFDDGSFYGCCAAIGAAGLAVYPLIRSLMQKKEENHTLNMHRLNGKTAFMYGPYVLARDSAKEPGNIDSPVRPVYESGAPVYTVLPCEDTESVRISLLTADGPVILTDYASCGKNWNDERNVITVWMN